MVKSTDMEKKKVIITLCKIFPVTHSKAGAPTGFEDSLNAGNKIHTVRFDGKDAWNKRYKDIQDGKKYLSIREWTGRPYNSEQRELARRDVIGLQRISMTYSAGDSVPQCWIDGKSVPVEEVAAHDGLSLEDFTEWFFHDTNTFDGVVIQFTDFRY